MWYRKKSNKIYAISNNSFIISDSGKLFGDYISCSKDLIKNGLRQPSSIHGYMLFYADNIKRNAIYEKMLKKRSIRKIEYMSWFNILNEINQLDSFESVETIYSLLHKGNINDLYFLKYENIDSNNELFLEKYNGSEIGTS